MRRFARYLAANPASPGLFVAAGVHGFGLVLLACISLGLLDEGGTRQAFTVEIEMADSRPNESPAEAATFEFARSEPQMLVTPEMAVIDERTFRRTDTATAIARTDPAEAPVVREPLATRPPRAAVEAAATPAAPMTSADASPPKRRLASAATSAVAVVPQAPASHRVGMQETPADFSGNSPAIYPAEARRRGLQGTVFLELHVAADGRVEEVIVLRSSGHPLLDGAAVSMVRHWQGRPRTRGGLRIASIETIPVHFRLR